MLTTQPNELSSGNVLFKKTFISLVEQISFHSFAVNHRFYWLLLNHYINNYESLLQIKHFAISIVNMQLKSESS